MLTGDTPRTDTSGRQALAHGRHCGASEDALPSVAFNEDIFSGGRVKVSITAHVRRKHTIDAPWGLCVLGQL